MQTISTCSAIILSLVIWGHTQAPAPLNWRPFSQGLKEAEDQHKYVLLSFFTNWCRYCRLMDSTTYLEPSVIQELKNNFISIRINAESTDTVTWQGKVLTKQQLTQSIGVRAFPNLIFLNSESQILASVPSFADDVLMNNLLKYISSGAKQRGLTFDEFTETQAQ